MNVLISGVTGQDGAFLSKQLFEAGHKVYGIARRVARSEPWEQNWRLRDCGVADQITLLNADVTNFADVFNIVRAVQPDQIYHLAAQSHVGTSFKEPFSTFQTNVTGTQNVLEAARLTVPEAQIYVAGSSEQFGNAPAPQGRNTQWQPRSPYGASKCAAAHLAHYYRNAHGMFVVVGLLFNHESCLRHADFVTRKIAIAAAHYLTGSEPILRLGNLDARRDWGYAADYTRAMQLMLAQSSPRDTVIATGVSRSVHEFCHEAFSVAGTFEWREFLVQDPTLMRPADVECLLGSPQDAYETLGWQPSITFQKLVEKMVIAEVARIKHKEFTPNLL